MIVTLKNLLKKVGLARPGRAVRDLYWNTTEVGLAKAISATLKSPVPSGNRRAPIQVFGPEAAVYDRETAQVMSRALVAASNCVDVGCCDGAILRMMLAIANEGHHYAFEPIPEKATELRRSFPTVRVFEVALSDSSGTAAFWNVRNNPAYSGLRKRSYDLPQHDWDRIIKVRTEKLDSIIPGSLKIDLVKIDVEGAELQVLQGGVRTIQRSKPFIVFECGLGAADYFGTKPQDIYDILTTEGGLKVSLMSRWLNGIRPLTRDEFVGEFEDHRNYYFLAYPLP